MYEPNDAACPCHPVRMAVGADAIEIAGFPGIDQKRCFCTFAEGSRYHEHGISTGSMLLCQRKAPIGDGDLVLVDVDGVLTIYQYRRDRRVKEDGEKRILHNKSKAYAKILGLFNIFG